MNKQVYLDNIEINKDKVTNHWKINHSILITDFPVNSQVDHEVNIK